MTPCNDIDQAHFCLKKLGVRCVYAESTVVVYTHGFFSHHSSPPMWKYTEEGAMPPLPGGSRPGLTCVCVVWKQGSAAGPYPRYVFLHVRVP